jgi:predicted ATPase
MSGSGKSSALAELRRRGFETVDTDEPEWTEWSTEEDGDASQPLEDVVAELVRIGSGTPAT